MQDWLDPATRAILCKDASHSAVAVETGAFSLLLLEKGNDTTRIEETVIAIRESTPHIDDQLPFVIARRLNYVDALAGQFALACSDCAAIVVPDDVIDRADRGYLKQLFDQVMDSSDFQLVDVKLSYVPPTDEGRRFCWQFLGLATGLAVPATYRVFRLKAEMMEHWAEKTGVALSILNSGRKRPPA